MGAIPLIPFDLLLITWFVFLLSTAVSWFIFSRVHLARLDKKMMSAGVPLSCQIDVMGLRVLMIATVLAIPFSRAGKANNNPIIEAATVKTYTTVVDRRMAIFLCISAYGFAALSVIGYFFIPTPVS